MWHKRARKYIPGTPPAPARLTSVPRASWSLSSAAAALLRSRPALAASRSNANDSTHALAAFDAAAEAAAKARTSAASNSLAVYRDQKDGGSCGSGGGIAAEGEKPMNQR